MMFDTNKAKVQAVFHMSSATKGKMKLQNYKSEV